MKSVEGTVRASRKMDRKETVGRPEVRTILEEIVGGEFKRLMDIAKRVRTDD
ncbi:hypothetical protein HK097_000948 [Rhizophlyctis rosea]|uniref:Uncharacterized protein n=1 Tax=Rhizophlyctis rosea TaxID=64517 RepID=A0AAD5S4X2_9FUNG|nr:hypothetical protein HK097_000948 [Rhizophlyctis rosea]